MSPLLVMTLVFNLAAGQVPYQDVQAIAQSWAMHEWPEMTLGKVLTYYDFDGEVNAYAFIFSKKGVSPDLIPISDLLVPIRPRNRHGVDRFATIIMGAHYSQAPVLQYYRGLPSWYSIRRYLPAELKSFSPSKVIYTAPMEEWVEFETSDGSVLVDGYSARSYSRQELLEKLSFDDINLDDLSITKRKWTELKNNRVLARDTVLLDSPPFYEWHYGCSPTASAMLLGWHDVRGYARLLDFFFGPSWSIPEGQWDDGIPNMQRELALAMYTDTTTGGTSIYNIDDGQRAVCNGYGNNYNFTSYMVGPGSQSNPITWATITQEIDAGRPFNWSVFYHENSPDAGHSLACFGYATVGSQRFVWVNTTWYENEEFWEQYTSGSTRDYAYPLGPGGSIDCDLDQTSPLTSTFMFQGIRYKFKWMASGSQAIDHLNIYYHEGYNSSEWTTLATGVSNTGEWVWTAPTESLEARIALRGYNSSNNLIAADGESLAFTTKTYEHSPELVLVGHYDTDGGTKDLFRSNDYLYCAEDYNGIAVVDIADSSLPELVGSLSFPSAVALDYQNQNLFIADEAETVYVVDVSDPANPNRIGEWAAPDKVYDVKVYNTDYLVCACRTEGVFILDISTPSNPTPEGQYNTAGQSYGVDIQGDIAYVADGTQGMRVIDISDPANMTEIGSYDPIGIANAVGVGGNRAYLVNGGLGIKIADISDPTNPQEVGEIDTPGTATWVKQVSATCIYVGDGESGLRIYDVSDPGSPTEMAYLDSHGEAATCAFNGDLIYLADGGDGIYVIHSDLIGVAEGSNPQLVRFTIPNLIRDRLVIEGSVPIKTQLSVEINDIIGRKVKSFDTEVFGNFSFSRPISLSSGVYFISVSGGGRLLTSKAVVIR